MNDQTCESLRWTLRTSLMFFVGVLPAIALFVFILVMMPLAAILPSLVSWLAVVAVLALLGIAGLWTRWSSACADAAPSPCAKMRTSQRVRQCHTEKACSYSLQSSPSH